MKKRKLRKIIREEAKRVLEEERSRLLGSMRLEDGFIDIKHFKDDMEEGIELYINNKETREEATLTMPVDDIFEVEKLIKKATSRLNI